MSNQWSPLLVIGWIFAMLVENVPMFKQIWQGVSMSKKDLKVNWKKLEEAERNIKK